ncbi:MAG TPA: imidazole glycerol phosphate synthase subunit HisH [Steroidobacteraceae bacterium]|nr:imidazole glycerol phosphate synthase subunit HisH [Steroidobacteraceae bacterium]HRX91108.1 imidazole glycerol phosphate synthase subunit HisH [Steroidobacteraceae bacterium]
MTPLGVAIVDSGGANLASLELALQRLGTQPVVTNDAAQIQAATRVLLPGVGSAAAAMERLHETGLLPVISQLTQPVLGICLGMQLLFERTAEGARHCLGILPGVVRRIEPIDGLPVPHMGWNQLEIAAPDPLLRGVANGDYVYFVHSYAAAPALHTLATTAYGVPLAAVVRRANYWGTQFHPERSGSVGARILANFLEV